MRRKLFRKWWFWVLVTVAVIVLILHLFLAIWVRDYVNRKLSEIPDYRAHVDAVTLHLWRGAYQIHNIKIEKTSGEVPVPFFAAPLVDLSVEWKALFNGSFVGEIDFHRPELNFVNGPSKAEQQAAVDEPWTQKIKQLFPLKFNRFAVHNGEVHYRDFSSDPKVDIVIDDVRMVATNLTNSKKLSKTLIAEIQGEGRPMREGNARMQMSLDPYAAEPSFALNLEVRDLSLPKLNDFARAYGHFDFKSGTFRLATQLESKDGQFKGYVEPVFDNMDIGIPEGDKNPLSGLWASVVDGLTKIIRNQPKNRFGTQVPVSGSFDQPQPALITTIFNVFKNAFVKAFEGKLENENLHLPETVDPDKKD
ncbi:MAG TPA: DUF748 domain-containing protein [Chthoniobacterales bacterium]|nr:DUF748 domain-containing protein [Chthoniobacterales bacterium]